MKRTFTSILAAVAIFAPATAAAAETVPYSSDLGSNYSVCSDWKNTKGNGDNYWEYDRNSDFSTPGTGGGVIHTYELDYNADAMLISPAISVTEGTTYTVVIWAKTYTNAYSETENFKVLMGSTGTSAALKSGTVLIDCPDFRNNDDFERMAKTFTASATEDVYFGLYCYSEAYQGNLCLTGFSIVEGDATVMPEPEPVVVDLPYQPDFSSSSKDFKTWKSLAGPEAGTAQGWTYNSYGGYPEFDASYGLKEDNYFISPALNITEADNYAVSFTYTAYGSFDVVLGTDDSDPASFNRVLFSVDNVTDFEVPAEFSFDIDQPGKYYVALHVRSEEGSYMGYRLHSFKIKQNIPVPALIADLKAISDANDALKVELSWTNPSVFNTGAPLDKIVSAEVYRNGTLLATVTDCLVPGQSSSYSDAPETAGVYKYYVVLNGEKGALDAQPMEVSAGYVGRPEAGFPYYLNINYAYDDDLAIFSTLDANNNGHAWEVITQYYTQSFTSSNDYESGFSSEADNYLASPYIHLAKGYYMLTSTISGRANDFEIGIATDRHNIDGTFTAFAEILDEQETGYNDYKVIIPIDQEGDYCLVWHHFGLSHSSGYNSISLKEISLGEQALLPGVADEFTVEPVGTDLKAVITWTNPDIDNAKRPLSSISKVEIYRNGDVIATITENLVPGEENSYTDTEIPESAEYTYSVVVYNENGCATEDAPSATLFVGKGYEAPYVADFKDWTIVDLGAWYAWKYNETDGSLYFERGYFDDSDYNDGVYSPFIYLEQGKRYIVTFNAFGKSTSQEGTFTLQAGTSRDALIDLCEYTKRGSSIETFTATIIPQAEAVEVANDNNENLAVPVGNVVLGFHISQNGDVNIQDFKVEVDSSYSGIEDITEDVAEDANAPVNVYNLQGIEVLHSASKAEINALPAGIYVAGGKKIVIR